MYQERGMIGTVETLKGSYVRGKGGQERGEERERGGREKNSKTIPARMNQEECKTGTGRDTKWFLRDREEERERGENGRRESRREEGGEEGERKTKELCTR